MSNIIPALTLWQPWASLIAHGLKEYETRHWAMNKRGLIAIHAAKRWTEAEKQTLNKLCRQFPDIARAFLDNDPPLGAVLCVCNLTAIYPTGTRGTWAALPEREYAVGNWSPGRFAWRLEVVRVFDEPVPAQGHQGIWRWTVPDNVRIT